MNDFQYQQRERLIVENEIKYWAKRWNEVENKKLREDILIRARETIISYETQIPCLEYHLDRFNKLKKLYSYKGGIKL